MKSEQNSILNYLLPRLQDMLFICIFISVIGMGPRLFNLDGDLGRHITIGNYIIEKLKIPTVDIFSHSMAGNPLVPHEWLAQVTFSVATKLMGLNGDVILSALVISFAFTIKYREITSRGIPALIATLTIIWAAAASSIHWLSRPHIFTFLFLSLWTYQLEQVISGKQNRIWIFPLLMLVWANTHGAFIAGFVVWGAYIAEWFLTSSKGLPISKQGSQLAIIGLTSLTATFINPAGYHLWLTSIGYIGNSYLVSHTMEYMPPNFQNLSMWPFMFMLIYSLFSLHTNEKLPLREVLLLAGWTVMALFSMRNIPLFAIVAAPIIAKLLQKQTEQLGWLKNRNETIDKVDSQLKGAGWPILIVLSIIFAFNNNIPLDINRQGNQFDPHVFPVAAMNWLQTHPQEGHVFNYFTWGGYILYETWPKYPVFIDGQTDFYGESLTREYEAIYTQSKGWEGVLVKYNISWALIESNSSLAKRLINELKWNILYEDPTAIILRK